MRKFILFLLFFYFSLWGFTQSLKNNFNTDSLIKLMTLEEKIDFIAGYKNFNIKGFPHLGIPQIKMADGPMGVKGHGKATAFPASICMAATWNPRLIKEMASAIAIEAKSKEIGILLAPGVNMYRVPQCGRNFEYYGEDPLLASKIAVSFIQGVQKQKVMATVKHFVANNQDYDRHRVSSNIDERTLNELYFPVFKAALKDADVGAVMTSYNLLNGIHTSESQYLINDVLKSKWGFDGIVMSDWISVYSNKAFKVGLDLEMPRSQFMNKSYLIPLIKANPYYENILNDKVSRIINTCNRIGLYEPNTSTTSVDWNKHKKISKQVAREGFVLLKNKSSILPITGEESKRILVLGPNALNTPYSGGGAAKIDAYKVTSFHDGIKNNTYPNCLVDYMSLNEFIIKDSISDYPKFCEKLKIAKKYNAVVICVGFNSKTEGEAFDRPFALPSNQDLLITEISKYQKNSIVVMNSGGGVYMPWLDKIKALIYTWYPGQDGGNALGEILFGKINPSGKLPISIEKRWKDNAAFSNYDTTHAVLGAKPFYTLYGKQHKIKQMDYEEGIFSGYRHYDTRRIEPLFHFGFGLSYSSFKLSKFSIDKKLMDSDDSLKVNITIKNTGKFDGAETVQLYIRDVRSSLPRPVKELKAFRKVFLRSGEKRSIEFTIDQQMLKYYNPEKHDWIAEDGYFEILIGNSSGNIQHTQIVQFKNI